MPEFAQLNDKLLKIGGERVAERFEEDLHKLLTRGEIIKPKKVVLVKMRDCQCHANSATFYENYSQKNGFDNVQIVTGWALSKDNIWRQHSWIYMPMDDVIVETTLKRKIYFGFYLNNKESELFCENNQ
jgi:hypothetical protein